MLIFNYKPNTIIYSNFSYGKIKIYDSNFFKNNFGMNTQTLFSEFMVGLVKEQIAACPQ